MRVTGSYYTEDEPKTWAGKTPDHMIKLTFSNKSSVLAMLSVDTNYKTQSKHYQILPLLRAFSKSSVFVTDSLGVHGRPNRRN